jgi:prepilin-type N-terminal cleavage/methylation domain-containing protein
MGSGKTRQSGFTLIELMVTVAVIVVLMLIAIPSFQAFRQRASVRAAADQAVVLWNQARFEAAKRNTYVKVARQTSGGSYCLGAATTTNPADTTACDCFSATACDVARFPATQSDWRGASMSASTNAALGVVVLEPKRAFLTAGSAANAGGITFTSPSGPYVYKINMRVDAFGRAFLCEPNNVAYHLSDFSTRQCSP